MVAQQQTAGFLGFRVFGGEWVGLAK